MQRDPSEEGQDPLPTPIGPEEFPPGVLCLGPALGVGSFFPRSRGSLSREEAGTTKPLVPSYHPPPLRSRLHPGGLAGFPSTP